MAEETIITWNFTNWVTVFVMAVAGVALVTFAMQAVHKARGTGTGG